MLIKLCIDLVNSAHTSLQIEQSGIKLQLEALCCVLRQDISLSLTFFHSSYPDLKPQQTLHAHPANCICIKFDPKGRYGNLCIVM